MKKTSFLSLFIYFSYGTYAQKYSAPDTALSRITDLHTHELTPPDTLAVISSKVKMASIYYKKTGISEHLAGKYKYDKKGNCIFEQCEGRGYYYNYNYNSKNQCIGIYQRGYNKKIMYVCINDFYKEGKKFHTQIFNESDTIFPYQVSTYDLSGVETERIYFKGKEKVRTINYKEEQEKYKKSDNKTGKAGLPLDRMYGGRPSSKPIVTHDFIRDNKNNIISDKVITNFNGRVDTSFFSYEYEYWK